MTIVEYDENGRILSVITYPVSDQEVTEMPLYQGRLFLPLGYLIDWNNDYVRDGEIVKRPSSGIVLDGHVLRGVAEGSTVTIDGQDYTADGTDIELDFEFPGNYLVRVSLWPYLDYEVFYEAHA